MKHRTVAEILVSMQRDEQIITNPVPKGLRSNTPPPQPRVVNYPIEETWDHTGLTLVIFAVIMLLMVLVVGALMTSEIWL